ncbi:MAG: hypothetical protein K1X26_06090 [Chitinophagales bacterium]|nr:hypothetical protein [Chitinophagales bacterium]HNK90427.1 hypothetical protein [Chitinophagales bacterium]
MERMKLKFAFFSICAFYFLNNYAKVPELLTTIPEKAFDIQINYSDEIIILQKGNVKKFDTQGNLLATYGNIYINQQTEIISYNTFRTILFCPDFGKIIILDKRFGVVSIVDVYNIADYFVSKVGISYDNSSLWFWDDIRQVLIKTNQKNDIIYVSNNMQIYVGKTIHPMMITELATKLYLNDTTQGLFVFDNTGTYKKLIPIANIQSFYEKEGLLFYVSGDGVYSYNAMTFEQTNYTSVPKLNQLKIGQTVLCGINSYGLVEIWNY